MLQLASLVRRLVGNTTLQVGGLAANTTGLSSYVLRAVLCNYDGLAQLLHAMTPAQHRAFHDRCCGTNGCENSFGRYSCYLGRKPPAAEFADAGPKLMDQNELARMNPTERGFYPALQPAPTSTTMTASTLPQTYWSRGGMGGGVSSCQPPLAPATSMSCGATGAAPPASSACGASGGRPSVRPRGRARGRSAACTATGATSRPRARGLHRSRRQQRLSPWLTLAMSSPGWSSPGVTVPRPRERPTRPGSVAERCAYRRTPQRNNNGPDRRSGRATLLIMSDALFRVRVMMPLSTKTEHKSEM